MKKTIQQKRLLRKKRVRAKIFGTSLRPRLSVFRGSKHITLQLIDDEKRTTLVGMTEKILSATEQKKKKIERARLLGALLAKRAQEKGILSVVFDRGGKKYHGRVQAIAEGAREGGLEF